MKRYLAHGGRVFLATDDKVLAAAQRLADEIAFRAETQRV